MKCMLEIQNRSSMHEIPTTSELVDGDYLPKLHWLVIVIECSMFLRGRKLILTYYLYKLETSKN